MLGHEWGELRTYAVGSSGRETGVTDTADLLVTLYITRGTGLNGISHVMIGASEPERVGRKARAGRGPA